MNIETANRLVKLRKAHGYSQESLAEKIGVSRQAVSKWERSEASPDTDNLILLAELYGVSLDELLLGKETDESTEPADEQAKEEPAEDAEDRVSFAGGIHVHDKHGTKVDIGFDGIHVEEPGDGAKVHIGRNGVFVSENGHIHVDRSAEQVKKSPWRMLPVPILTVIAYLLMGFCLHLWWIGWIVFFIIPIYYSLVDAIEKRNPDHFAYPVLVTAVYLFLGMAYSLWHPWWWLFLTIPAYYAIAELFKKSE